MNKVEIIDIETERLLLRKFKETDANDYAEFMSDKHTWQFQPDNNKTKNDYINEFPKVLAEYRKRTKIGMQRYAISIKNAQKVIGYVGVAVNWPNSLGRLSWALNSEFWHKGYATEAVSAIIDYMFSAYNLHRIEINVWQGNVASQNLALRLGFKQEGVDREARLKNGEYLDSINFGLLRSEWEKSMLAKKEGPTCLTI